MSRAPLLSLALSGSSRCCCEGLMSDHAVQCRGRRPHGSATRGGSVARGGREPSERHDDAADCSGSAGSTDLDHRST